MQVFILTLGTRGDFELFLNLGRELRRRGHRVLLGTSAFYAERTRSAQLEWIRVGNGDRERLVAMLRSLSPVTDKTRRTYLFYNKWLRPQLAVGMEAITAAGAQADYFISNLKMVLERGGKTVPGAAVTYDPPLAVEDLPQYGTQDHGGRILDLVALNRDLVDPENRWGEQYRFTGFWREAEVPGWSPSAELLAFLGSGPPPVVATLGSMVMFDPGKFARDLAAALQLCAGRGILVGGWSEIPPGAPVGEIFRLREAPYGWLFPQASCVIHHGGVGTLGAVLRAGKPSILLPQIACQEVIARMLMRENLATGIFNVDDLDPPALAAAVRRAAQEERFRESARRWQRVVSAERGIEAAADLIEDHRLRIEGDEAA